MTPHPDFAQCGMEFWANVRLIGQKAGYTRRGTGAVMAHDADAIRLAVESAGLDPSYLRTTRGKTRLAKRLEDYFAYRAEILNSQVEPQLMDLEEAKGLFAKLREDLRPSCPIPDNKQKGNKKGPAYFTGTINMLIEANSQGHDVDYEPGSLTIFTQEGRPLRTLARRVDGCFPSAMDPVAMWEIKEYYHTTTFGSRVADGVYETIMDGMELEELRLNEGREVRHYLMVDGHYTWWKCGRSYLCRIIDAMHMGHLDEALFGSEVVSRLPTLVEEWAALASADDL